MKIWFEILSELFVNLAAGWFAVVFIEPQITDLDVGQAILPLTLRFLLSILSLIVAKILKEKIRK